MMQVDSTTLTQVITNAFNLSMDGRLSTAQQMQFNNLGKRLRGDLLDLLSSYFNDGTQAVLNANAQLAAVNTQIQQATNDLANIATVVQNVANLAGVLDGLLALALKII